VIPALGTSVYFLDSSALVKRYGLEAGTAWISQLWDPLQGNIIAVARITIVEVAAALASKRRADTITQPEYVQALKDVKDDFVHEYLRVNVGQSALDLAVDLTERNRLRGYDAVQLAAALTLNSVLTRKRLPPLTFVCADRDLLIAAQAEGLVVDDPNQHP